MGYTTNSRPAKARRLSLVALILLYTLPAVGQPSPPPKGKGWWYTSNQEWTLLSCPKVALGSGQVQRLPQGCSALYPTIAYTVDADILVRKDLAEANVRIQGLKQELTLSRKNLTDLHVRLESVLVDTREALDKSIKLNDLQLEALKDAEKALFWSKVYSAAALVGGVVLVTAVAVF